MEDAAASANEEQDSITSRYAVDGNTVTLAAGGIFKDVILGPKESVEKTYLFFVPKGKLDPVEDVVNFWLHNGSEELWAEISIPKPGEFNNSPCLVVTNDPWKCEPIQVGGPTRTETQDQYDLWEFEARATIPLPAPRPNQLLQGTP